MSDLKKYTKYGVVELKYKDGKYWLYVNGAVKSYSSDFNTMLREYEKYN